MKSLKIQISAIFILAACLMVPAKSMAQWSVGASYEIRDQEPKNGFGLRVERSILNKVPIVDLGLRAHFSFFNEENEFNQNNQSISAELTYYDYGLAATGGFSLGLLKPYVGLGIGNNSVKFDSDQGGSGSESSFFWNTFVGAEISPIPVLKPFIEYRFQPTDEFENVGNDFDSSNGRLIFGLSLNF